MNGEPGEPKGKGKDDGGADEANEKEDPPGRAGVPIGHEDNQRRGDEQHDEQEDGRAKGAGVGAVAKSAGAPDAVTWALNQAEDHYDGEGDEDEPGVGLGEAKHGEECANK